MTQHIKHFLHHLPSLKGKKKSSWDHYAVARIHTHTHTRCICVSVRVISTFQLLDQFSSNLIETSWNVMAHTQKPDFIFQWNAWVHLNQLGHQFSRPLAAEMCASAVVMLDTPCSEVVWRVLATHSIRQFPLHFPSRASPCAITFQLHSKNIISLKLMPTSHLIVFCISNNLVDTNVGSGKQGSSSAWRQCNA